MTPVDCNAGYYSLLGEVQCTVSIVVTLVKIFPWRKKMAEIDFVPTPSPPHLKKYSNCRDICLDCLVYFNILLGSWADIRTKGWWGIWYEKGHVMFFLSYTWHKRTCHEIGKLQCDIDYWKGYDLFQNCMIKFLYQSAEVISGKSLMHFIRFWLLYRMVKKMLSIISVW